jgi:peptidoglycan/xylan/chitin deacetylase (PgdA/CDA1 family)
MIWPDVKRWVYSITYDEGCADLLRHALPLHRKYGIPGHVALVASQIGVPRDVPGSSYHGMMILSKPQIHDLAAEGWGVSCHSMTHAYISDDVAEYEVVGAKRVLEDAIGMPVRIFCVPGNNLSYPATLKVARRAGYDAIMTIYDRPNTFSVGDTGECGDGVREQLMALGRVPIHTEYPEPFNSVFDPYKRLHQARDLGGWIIDYTHCPMPGAPIHPAKDCTTEELEARFAKVREVGGGEVWLAEPSEVVAWLLGE